MMNKQVRYTSEKQILDLIDRTRANQKRALHMASALAMRAEAYIKSGADRADIAWAREQSGKAIKRAEGHEAKIQSLGKKLAAFRTELLACMDQNDRWAV